VLLGARRPGQAQALAPGTVATPARLHLESAQGWRSFRGIATLLDSDGFLPLGQKDGTEQE